MDDLLAFVTALIRDDPDLLAQFNALGLAEVDVRPMFQRVLAGYPRLLVDVEEGAGPEYGDDALPQFVDASVEVEIVAQQGDKCSDPLTTLLSLLTRTQTLLLGDSHLSVPGLKGQDISDKWSVTKARQNGSRRLPSDVSYPRYRLTVAVQLCRRDL